MNDEAASGVARGLVVSALSGVGCALEAVCRCVADFVKSLDARSGETSSRGETLRLHGPWKCEENTAAEGVTGRREDRPGGLLSLPDKRYPGLQRRRNTVL